MATATRPRIAKLLEEAISSGEVTTIKELLSLCDNIYYTGKKSTYQGQTYSLNDLPSDQLYDSVRKTYTPEKKPTDYYKLEASRGDKNGLVEHPYPMGSLTKYKGTMIEAELPLIYNRLGKGETLFASGKVDGVSLEVFFENGILIMALTRHDHKLGRLSTAKASKFVPRPDPSFHGRIVVRGETIMRGEDFKTVGYENRRNGASGILGRKDDANTKLLHFIAYEIKDYSNHIGKTEKANEKAKEEVKQEEGKQEAKKEKVKQEETNVLSVWPEDEPKTMLESFNLLKRLGFEVPPYMAISTSNLKKDFFASLYNKWRTSLDYDIDGIVVGPVSVTKEVSDPPKMTVAVKFDASGAWTKVTDILPRATRTGNVIPQVYIESVEVSGSTISTIAGANYTKLIERGIKKGSRVYVIKSNEVIPYIEKVEGGETVETVVPTKCPSCGFELVIEEGERILKCPNPECPAKIAGAVQKYIKAIGVMNFGGKRLEALQVESIEALYNMSASDMIGPGIGLATAESLFKQLRSVIVGVDEAKLLASIGPHMIGEKTAVLITRHFHIDHLFGEKPLTINELRTVKGIGEEKANELIKFHVRGSAIIKMLKQYGLSVTPTSAESVENEGVSSSSSSSSSGSAPTENLVVCLTGTGSISRSQYEAKIAEKGWRTVNAISKRVNLVVTDDTESVTVKMQHAKALGIRIVSYSDFDKTLGLSK